MVVTLFWEISGGFWGLQTVYPALASSLFCLIVVSLFTAPPPSEKVELFFEKRKA
jgi:hypothetical protein